MHSSIARRARAAFGRRRTPETPPPAAARHALVIDLDNIGPPAKGNATALLDVLLDAVGPFDTAIAAGRDDIYAAWAPACRARGIAVFEAPSIRDGADRALLASAEALSRAGITDFTVISCDHAFAALPGTLRCVMPDHRQLSIKLASRCASVTTVVLPTRANARRVRRSQPGLVAATA